MCMISGFQILHSFKPSGQKEVHVIKHPDYGICVMKKGSCSNESSLERIKREVTILKSITSDYYPKNYHFEYDQNGQFTIIEEYIASNTLRDVMDKYSTEENVTVLFLQLIDGLTILWDNEQVHRDLKPENILIKKDDGNPVIIDLGIARDNNAESLTNTIFHSGPRTNGYCSPEQLQNNKDLITYKTDFFAIGIMMAELIIGANPFSPQLNKTGISCNDNIMKNQFSLKNGNKSVSVEMTKIINRLLKPLPFQRYRTYSQLIHDLQGVLHHD